MSLADINAPAAILDEIKGSDLNPMLHGAGGFLGANVNGQGKRLAYPSTLETDNDEHTHFIVFHIWSETDGQLHGNMTDAQVTSANKLKQDMWGGQLAGGGIGGLGGIAVGRAINSSKGMQGAGKKWRTLLSVGLAIGGGYAGQAAGAEAIRSAAPIEDQNNLQQMEALKAQKMLEDIDAANKTFAETGRLARIGEATSKTKDTIALYMPQKIQSLSLLEYESQDMSVMQNLINDKAGLGSSVILAKFPKLVDSITSFVGLNSNLDAYMTASARIAANPRKQLLFREPISRKFEFQFNFSPRNHEESIMARDIIKLFKHHAYPTLNKHYGHGAFYNFPAEFEIEYHTVVDGQDEINPWINKIGRCALREINVDYASAGSFSTFDNGAPTNMVLSLTFEEMALLDSNLIDQGY